MLKRILSFCLTLLLLSGVLPLNAFAAAAPEIYFSEGFEGFATNEEPSDYQIKGLDCRVIEVAENDKALYGKMWGSSFSAKLPFDGKSDRMIYSFDIKIVGAKVVGTALRLSASTNLLNYRGNGSVYLEDGLNVDGYSSGLWHRYTAIVDYRTKRYSLEIDGKRKFSNRLFNQSPIAQSSVDFSFQTDSDDGVSEIYIDNVRVYSGGEVLDDAAFPVKAYKNETLDFTPTEEQPDTNKIFVNSKGKLGLGSDVITFVQKEGNTAGWAPIKKGGEEYIHFSQESTTDCFANLNVDATGSMYLVFEAELYPVAMETATADVFRTNSTGSYSNLLTLSGLNLLSNSTKVATLSAEKWTKVTLAADFLSGKADIYVDDDLKKEDVVLHEGGVIPTGEVRIACRTITGNTGHNEWYMRNVKIYEGKEPRELPEVEGSIETVEETSSGSLGLTTIQHTKAASAKKIGKAAVFMTSGNSFFADSKKQTYPQGKEAYVSDDGVKMVAAEVMAEALHEPITCTEQEVTYKNKTVLIGDTQAGGKELDAAPVKKDGVVYLPVASYAQRVLGKKVYDDSRGMVVVSDEAINLSNSSARSEAMEESDIIFRYMLYDRPTGDQLYKQLKEENTGHPRLFVKNEDIPALRAKVEASPELRKELQTVLKECDELIETPPVAYNIPDGLRLIAACQEITDRIVELTVANLVTGDTKYLDRMWVEVQNAFTYPDWNMSKHYLDSGEIGPGIALAYDMLYNHLSEKERQWFRDKFVEYYLDFAVGVYTGRSTFTAFDTRMVISNWGAVIGNSHLMCALAMLDSEDEDSEFTEKIKFLAENAVQAIEVPMGAFFPDGAIDEGVGYWSFYTKNLTYSVRGLMNCFGDDFGFLDSPGYRGVPDYLLYAQSTLGYYSYADAGDSNGVGNYISCPEALLICDFYGDYEKMDAVKNMLVNLKGRIGSKSILWYEPEKAQSSAEGYPLDYLFNSIQLTVMKSAWDDDMAAYLGAIGGETTPMNHWDKGSFIFDVGGVRWFSDMGSDNYNVTGGYSGLKGATLYRKRAEGHNCLVINPTAADPGQVSYSYVPVEKMETKARGGISVYDLSEAYAPSVSSYRRGFYLGDNRQSLLVQDEFELKEANSEVYSFFHTTGKIEISADKKSAVITSQGKKLKAEILTNISDWKLEARDTSPLFAENTREGERSRAAYSKLAFVANASGNCYITVKFTLLDDLIEYSPITYQPIDSWTIPDGEIPAKSTVTAIYMDGKALEGFNPAVSEYTVPVVADEQMPAFTADSPDGVITVETPSSFDGTVRIIAQNEGGKRAYTVKFEYQIRTSDALLNISPVNGIPGDVKQLPVSYCYADSNPQPDNGDINAVDGNLETRWSCNTNPCFLEVDLGESKEISGVAIAYMDSHRFYKYDILVSEDKINYTRIYSGTSSGLSNVWDYLPCGTKARYVRYVGYGHADGDWNSVLEFRPCGK